MNKVKKYTPELAFLCLFLILIPVANKVTYMQNDEWIFYDNIHRFIQGHFTLNPLTAPTFYTQGILAYLVQLLLGMHAIPYLTLAVSIGSLYLLYRILRDRYGMSIRVALILTAFLLVNPLFSYSTWGFMTDNYFLFFFLLTYYFYLDAESSRGFIFGSLCLLLAYMVRQLGLVLPISFAVFYLLRKKWVTSIKLFIIFSAFTFFNFFLMPKTSEIIENGLELSNLAYFRYVFSLSYILIIYLVAFSLPLVTMFVINTCRKSPVPFLIAGSVALVLTNLYFMPSIVRNEHFYYLNNIAQRNGFFVENLHGTKPKFMDYQIFYTAWGLLSKLGAVFAVLEIIVKRKLADINLILMGVYGFLLLISPKLHDRYLIPLFALSILFFCVYIKFNKVLVIISVIYLLLMGFYTYNYTADYIVTNNYVWNKSVELTNYGVDPKNIISTSAWNLNYNEKGGTDEYKFTYDAPTMQNYSTNFTLQDVFEVKYPLRIWKNTKIYLYKKIV